VNRLRRSGRGPTPKRTIGAKPAPPWNDYSTFALASTREGSETMGEVQTARLFGLSLAATLFVVLALNVYAYH
jgi:hypothetical protein